MTNEKKTAVEQAMEDAKEAGEKLALKWLVARKNNTRKDNLDAVSALGDSEDWGEIEILMVMAHKETGKSYEELEDLTQAELETLVL